MNKKNLIPEAKEALQRFKVEAALEVGIKLKHTHQQNSYLNNPPKNNPL